MTLNKIKEFLFDKMKFCGCGDPESAVDLLRDVLNILALKDEENYSWDEINKQLNSVLCYEHNRGLYYTYLYLIDDVGITEHGGSVPGYLTDLGEELLDGLRKYSSEDIMNS